MILSLTGDFVPVVVEIIGSVQVQAHIIGFLCFSCFQGAFCLHEIDILPDFFHAHIFIEGSVRLEQDRALYPESGRAGERSYHVQKNTSGHIQAVRRRTTWSLSIGKALKMRFKAAQAIKVLPPPVGTLVQTWGTPEMADL